MINIHPETRARRNLAVFKLTAWTTRPELIPETKLLVVPEPVDMDTMRDTLKYPIQIRVQRLLMRLPPDSPPASLPLTPPDTQSSDDDSPATEGSRQRAASPGGTQGHDTPPRTVARAENTQRRDLP